jgi:hypothetical protein
VKYVIIGGIAAQLHDLPVPATVDIDVTPARDHENLERLARAFDELKAGLYTAEEAGTWFPRTPVEQWAQYDTAPDDHPWPDRHRVRAGRCSGRLRGPHQEVDARQS